MKGCHGFKGALGVLGLALAAQAHLVAGSLSIKGGETFEAGATVNVKWTQNVGHDGKYDFKFSKDGGATWTDVEKNKQMPTAAGELTYPWTVPNEATAQGQFRVCQLDGGNQAACTHATYMLKSPNFTISGGTLIRRFTIPAAGSLRFDPPSRNLEVSFALAHEGEVLVQAFDPGGRLVATLLEERRPAGSHEVSVFSNRLDAGAPLVFRLTAGGKTFSRPFPGLSP